MSNYVYPEVLVTLDWVEKHRDDPKLRLVEVDVDTSAYDTGHIAGAVGWNWQTELQDQLRRDVAPREAIEQLLGKSGIDRDTTIVLYGDNNNWFAAYAFWLLRYYGHEKLVILDGGRKKWLAEGRALTAEKPKVTPTGYRAKEPDSSIRVFRDYLFEKRKNGDGLALVDVRSPQEFSGEILAPPGFSETAQRGGHIPGAKNIPWSQAVREDGTFKSFAKLKTLYGNQGITSDKEVIAYCRIGERSSHTWFVLKYLLGYPQVRNYDGSWTEWGSVINHPIER